MRNSNYKLEISAVSCGACLNLILFALKLYIGLRTASICIYADAINNFADIFCCALAILGFFIIRKPSNKNYPLAYGRAENLAAMLLSLLIISTGAYLAYNSLERLFYPRPVWFLSRFAHLLSLTAVLKLIMFFTFKRIYKKTNSIIIKTIYLDSLFDAAATTITLLSFLLSQYSGLLLDPIFGFIISFIILANGLKLIFSSLSPLMGKNDTILSQNITNHLLKNKDIINISKIMIHSYGKNKAATLEIASKRSLFQEELAMAEELFEIELYIKYIV